MQVGDAAEKVELQKEVRDFLVDDEGTIFELGYSPLAASPHFFIGYTPAGEVLTVPAIRTGSKLILPLGGAMVAKGVIRLPSEATPYGTDVELIALVRQFIHKYVALSPFGEQLATYYVLLTWVYDQFDVLPYLRYQGDWGCGKSRALQTVGNLCYRATFASGATTSSPVFRCIDAFRGTLVLDEADLKDSQSHTDLIKILNCGYMRGFPVIRSEVKGKSYEPMAFDVYGPKLIATRKKFQDRALESRCFTEKMDFSMRPDVPITLPDSFDEEALEIRNRLLMWRFRKWGQVKLDSTLKLPPVEPRLKQVATPLLSLMDDSAVRERVVGLLKDYNRKLIEDRRQSADAEVLSALVYLHDQEEKEKPRIKEIADRVNASRGVTDKTISARKVGYIVGDVLGLEKKEDRDGWYVVWSEERVTQLCEKYGLIEDERTGCGHVDFVDVA